MSTSRLKDLRERAGLSMQALADRIGTSAPQINKLEKGKRRMTLDWLARLAQGLKLDERELLLALQDDADAALPAPRSEAVEASASPADLIPLRSAQMAENGEMALRDDPVGLVARPPRLAHVRNAYAIYMLGGSMAPRFIEGQLLYVHPYKPPQAGFGVIVTTAAKTVLIREFLSQNPMTLWLRQYQPPATIEQPRAGICDLHMIVGLDEP